MWVRTLADGKMWELQGVLDNSGWAVVTFGGGVNLNVVPQVVYNDSAPYREIVVDPVNGDDSPDNDGYARPLKTLFALFQRLAARVFVRGNYRIEQPYVRLKAGVHDFAGIPGPSNYYEVLSPGNASIFGEWGDPLATFQLDSVAGDTTRWSKPAGDPGWSINAYAGKWIRVPITFPPPPGLPPEFYFDYFPILANTAHELTLGNVWSPIGWGDPPSLGTSIDIVEMVSIVRPTTMLGGYFSGRSAAGSGLSWQWVRFETAPGNYCAMYGNDCQMGFFSCHFYGNGGTSLVFADSEVTVRGPSLWENVFSALSGEHNVVHFWENAILNSVRVVELNNTRVDLWAHLHTMNSSSICFSDGRGFRVVDDLFAIAMRNTAGGFILDMSIHDLSNGGDLLMRSAPAILDGQIPKVWAQMAIQGKISVTPGRAEASIASLIHEYDTQMSFADLLNIHGKRYFGTSDIEFVMLYP
jgi:hypothetical protein